MNIGVISKCRSDEEGTWTVAFDWTLDLIFLKNISFNFTKFLW